MFEIFKKEDEKAKQIVTYSIDENGLEFLQKALSTYSADSYNYIELSSFYADINYLDGIADTLPNNEKMKAIIHRVSCFKNVLDCSITVTSKNIENDDI